MPLTASAPPYIIPDCKLVAVFLAMTELGNLKSTGSSTSNYSYGKNSATAWQYHFDTWTAWLSGIFTTGKYYAVGAWACFKLPYPTTSDNLPTDYTVGSLYKNPTLDTNNMHLTPSGETGFNASDSEELGILEALSFFIKFKYVCICVG